VPSGTKSQDTYAKQVEVISDVTVVITAGSAADCGCGSVVLRSILHGPPAAIQTPATRRALAGGSVLVPWVGIK